MDRATILLVEDDRGIRTILSKILSAEGYHVLAAAQGLEGLALLEKEPVDLMVLDVMLPQMDGFELCKKIRARREFDTLPILFLTGQCGGTVYKTKGLDLGADDYLTKPFDSHELRARIRSLLRRKDLHDRQEREGERLKQENQELTDQNLALAALADKDPMTQLYDEQSFHELLGRELARVEREQGSLVVVLVSIDRFDELTASLGQPFSEHLVAETARVIRVVVREADLLAHCENNTFGLVAVSTDNDGARQLAERLKTAVVEHRFFLGSQSSPVTISVGMASHTGPEPASGGDLVQQARAALEQAQTEGPNPQSSRTATDAPPPLPT